MRVLMTSELIQLDESSAMPVFAHQGFLNKSPIEGDDDDDDDDDAYDAYDAYDHHHDDVCASASGQQLYVFTNLNCLVVLGWLLIDQPSSMVRSPSEVFKIHLDLWCSASTRWLDRFWCCLTCLWFKLLLFRGLKLNV